MHQASPAAHILTRPTLIALSDVDRQDLAIVLRELEEARDYALRAQSSVYTAEMNASYQRRADALVRFMRLIRPVHLAGRGIAANEG